MSDFLNQLNEKVPIREGPEGNRSILREIYRAGHIAVKELSRKTLLPVPLVAKIVNFLIEKEVLDRIPDGILYTEKGMQFIESELGFYGFGISVCDECNGQRMFSSPRWDDYIEFISELFQNRPQVDTTLDQSLNTPETAVQRALYLYQCGALEGKRVLFLGDDDFTSVAMGMLYLGWYPEEPHLIPRSITVVDIDDRILEGIHADFQLKDLPITTIHWDYREAIPDQLVGQFDTIVVDPPYSLNGLILVLSRAIDLFQNPAESEVYLSFPHRSPSETHQFQQQILLWVSPFKKSSRALIFMKDPMYWAILLRFYV